MIFTSIRNVSTYLWNYTGYVVVVVHTIVDFNHDVHLNNQMFGMVPLLGQDFVFDHLD